MISLKNKQSGFTIVELLIVIVVIGILAALVITTFSGVQRRARNTERETDIKAVHGQVEAYYASNGIYPSLADLQSDTWVQSNLQGLDLGALRAPNQAANTIVGAGSGATGNYEYDATCDGSGANCSDYTLTANLEGGGTFTRDGLN